MDNNQSHAFIDIYFCKCQLTLKEDLVFPHVKSNLTFHTYVLAVRNQTKFDTERAFSL